MKIFYLLFFCFSFFYSQTPISSAEKNVLLQIYHQTKGEQWAISWDLQKDEQFWYGVKIKNGNVTEINLNGNLLDGTLPNLSSLTHLEKLNVGSNRLHGNINDFINLRSIKVFDISKNNFNGDISDVFSNFNNLTELYLGGNNFSIDSPENFLRGLTKITHIDISNCNLKYIPSGVLSNTLLKEINLSYNQLEGNLENIDQLNNLEKLDLSNNNLNILPSSISNLKELRELNLSNNKLESQKLSHLASLDKLEWLSLESNSLTNFPSILSQLLNLIHLNLGRNQIKDGLSQLSNLKSLQQLWLHNNHYEENFPAALTGLPNLMMLSLASNNFSGEIPASSITILDIRNNKFNKNQISNYLKLNDSATEFVYSPQRFDEIENITFNLGQPATLKQSLHSSDSYQFTWYKNFDEKIGQNTPQLNFPNIKKENEGQYTVEAYFLDTSDDEPFEISLFREPITVETTLGTKEIERQIAIYPNPAKDDLHIRTNGIHFSEAKIFDLSGKLYFTTALSQINVSSLPSGVYLLSLSTEKGILSFKWIKL